MSEKESKFDWLYKGLVPILVALIALFGVILTVSFSYLQSRQDKSKTTNTPSNKLLETTKEKSNYVIEVVQNSTSGIQYIENAEVRITIEGQPFEPDLTDKNGQVRFPIPTNFEGKEGQIIATQNGKSVNQNITVKFNKTAKIVFD